MHIPRSHERFMHRAPDIKVDLPDGFGRTPLFLAAAAGHEVRKRLDTSQTHFLD